MSDKATDLFASPCCKAKLTRQETRLECVACGHPYAVEDGLFKFTTGTSSHGEFSSEEMAELLKLAKTDGWKSALERYIRPRRPRAVQLLTDPRRYNSIEPLKAVKNGRVLDFGCGLGGVSLALATAFEEVVALDGSEDRVSLLNVIRREENLDNIVPVCHIDPANLPFPDSHFDAVLLIGVLEYLPQSLPDDTVEAAHEKCLKEFHRILRPGGSLLIHTKNRFGWQYWLGERDHSGLRFAPILPVSLTDLIARTVKGRPYRIINYSGGGYRKLMRKAGFDSVALGWPVPGYQTPDYLLSLEGRMLGELRKIAPDYHSIGKRLALHALGLTGLLRYVVPHYSVMATKRR
ncbi:class I SAM-dependent methyltransferase [Rhodospirillaceae bacterium SYSU D60014]|uniref:class I SAM-dependent methyltransferase n=1 Tax=Virgifigura deserti TaxID=2268457 RepID=UPI0013C40E4B